MDPQAAAQGTSYVFTFPMLIAGLLTLAGLGLGFLVKKWISDSEKAQDQKDASTHESFQLLHKRIDSEREKCEERGREETLRREALAEQVANLRVELAKAATREELAALNARIDHNTQEILKALAARG